MLNATHTSVCFFAVGQTIQTPESGILEKLTVPYTAKHVTQTKITVVKTLRTTEMFHQYYATHKVSDIHIQYMFIKTQNAPPHCGKMEAFYYSLLKNRLWAMEVNDEKL